MTKEQKDKYIKSPNHCPFCESESIQGNDRDTDGSVHTHYIECLDCEKTWADIFTLTDVQEDGV